MQEARQRRDRHATGVLARRRRALFLDAYFGQRWRVSVAHGKAAWAKLRFAVQRGDEEKRAEMVSQFWCAVNELGRLRAASILAQPPRGIELRSHEELCIGTTPSCDLIGFHAAERWQGTAFRWSGPVAIVPLDLPPGSYEIGIDTASLRGPHCDFPFRLMWNDTMIARPALSVSAGCVRARISADMFTRDAPQQLLIACAPPAPNPHGPIDPRTLGMPIRAIGAKPLAASGDHHHQEAITGPRWQAARKAGREHAQHS
jgi:hypothetical protein